MAPPILLQITSDWALGVCVGMPPMVLGLFLAFGILYLIRACIGRLLDKLGD